MCVWTKKRGSMKAVVLMATPCSKPLHGKAVDDVTDDDDYDVYYCICSRLESSKGRRRLWAFVRRSGRAYQSRYSWPLPALIHWDVKVGDTSMKDVGGAGFAGSSPPFLGRERAAVDVDVGPERRSPRHHETCLALESAKESSATK